MSHIPSISMKVASTLSAYRIVTCLTGTANSVKYPAAVSEAPIGVTLNDVLDITGAIPVVIGGIAKVYFNDTVASGALVASNNAGQAVPYVDNTAGGYVIGKLIGPAVALTGTIADVLIQPHWKIIT
jgi:hypothetical protein